jgi:hypothetical protein
MSATGIESFAEEILLIHVDLRRAIVDPVQRAEEGQGRDHAASSARRSDCRARACTAVQIAGASADGCPPFQWRSSELAISKLPVGSLAAERFGCVMHKSCD